MSRKTVCLILLVLALFLASAGLATLIPYPRNNMMSDLGYFAMCPFAPWSTLTLLGLGGLCWVVRQHIRTLPE